MIYLTELLKGIIPIEKKFMQPNHLFALEFREGFVFGRVVRRRICQWKPYPVIDSNGLPIAMLPFSAQAELRFRDPRNFANSILYLKSTTGVGMPWFYHGAIGLKTQYIQAYLRYPEAAEIPGKFANVDPIRPAAGDRISTLNGLNSPYEQPTDFHEIVIQPTKELGVEYFNADEARMHRPVLNLLFALYWTQLFTKISHPRLIGDIALKRYEGANASFLKVGFGDQPEEIGPETAKDWKVNPMTLDEASVVGGER